uniref:Uncharacterized protein n=1 Tax=Equus asinus TaxID=9793 RepID=A0A9L0KBC4_EQUAS
MEWECKQQEEAEADKTMEQKMKGEQERRKKKEMEERMSPEETKERILKLPEKLLAPQEEKHQLFLQLKKVLHKERKTELKEQNDLTTLTAAAYQQACPWELPSSARGSPGGCHSPKASQMAPMYAPLPHSSVPPHCHISYPFSNTKPEFCEGKNLA